MLFKLLCLIASKSEENAGRAVKAESVLQLHPLISRYEWLLIYKKSDVKLESGLVSFRPQR